MEKTELKKLCDKLPKVMRYNEINQELKRQGSRTYSDHTIRYVLNGSRQNDAIILAAIEVAKKHQEKLATARKKINNEL